MPFKADIMRFTHRTVNNNYFSIKAEIFAIKFLTLTLILSPLYHIRGKNMASHLCTLKFDYQLHWPSFAMNSEL